MSMCVCTCVRNMYTVVEFPPVVTATLNARRECSAGSANDQLGGSRRFNATLAGPSTLAACRASAGFAECLIDVAPVDILPLGYFLTCSVWKSLNIIPSHFETCPPKKQLCVSQEISIFRRTSKCLAFLDNCLSISCCTCLSSPKV